MNKKIMKQAIRLVGHLIVLRFISLRPAIRLSAPAKTNGSATIGGVCCEYSDGWCVARLRWSTESQSPGLCPVDTLCFPKFRYSDFVDRQIATDAPTDHRRWTLFIFSTLPFENVSTKCVQWTRRSRA